MAAQNRRNPNQAENSRRTPIHRVLKTGIFRLLPHCLLQFEQRLSFHDSTIFRKRMEGVDQQAVWPDIGLDEAQSGRRQPIWRVEAMRSGSPLTVMLKFFVHVEEHFGGQFLNLITHVIHDSVTALE